MAINKKIKCDNRKGGFPSFRRKQENPAENYLDRLEDMLDKQQSILLPRKEMRTSNPQTAPSPPPARQPEQEQPPAPSAPKQKTADVPEATPYYVFNQPNPEQTAQPPMSADDSAAEQPPAAAPPPIAPTSGYSEGAIILWEGPTLGIFKHHVPSKGYDLVYVLKPSGKMDPQGLALHAYGARQIGMLPDEVLSQFEQSATWNRDAIVFHLTDFSDSNKIPLIILEKRPAPKPMPTPHPAPNQTATPPTAQTPGPPKSVIDTLRRGTKIAVRIGDKEWQAIYWGRDQQGTVVAHNSTQDWRLMHLDLERFKDNLIVQGTLDDKEFLQLTRKIRHSASTKY